jgi:hypothetical protein
MYQEDHTKFGTIVFLEDGVELLGQVGDGKVRVVVYRDTRKGICHWYELDFCTPSGWESIFRVGDGKLQEAIDLFTQAKALAASSPRSGK